MGRKWWLSLPLVLVAGCAQFPDLKQALAALSPADQSSRNDTAVPPSQGEFSFDWVLGGDRSVAPLQVFDNGRQTWLQFASGSPVPAVFVRTSAQPGLSGSAFQDRLVALTRHRDYLVLDEVPLTLVFRGGHLQASARRPVLASPVSEDPERLVSNAVPASVVSSTPLPVPLPVPPRLPPLPAPPDSPVPPVPPAPLQVTQQGGGRSLAGASLEQVLGRGIQAPSEPVSPVSAQVIPLSARFEVSPADMTLRQVLGRWASASGWHFGPEHWMVDVDIPIIAAASFNLPFVDAVRELVSSTEMAQRPLQPCFYSNQVLRVVPYTHACNRVAHQESAS